MQEGQKKIFIEKDVLIAIAIEGPASYFSGMTKILGKSRRYIGMLLLGLVVLNTGCARKYEVRPFDVTPYTSSVTRSHSAVVVFTRPTSKDEYEYEELARAFQKVFADKLGGAFKELRFVKSESEASDYDLLMLSTLHARTVNDYWTQGCLLNFTIEIKDKSGKVLSKANSELKRSFSYGRNKAFKLAMPQIFDKVMTEALSNLEKNI